MIPTVGGGQNTPIVPHACRMRRLKGVRSRWQRVYGVGLRRPPMEPLQSYAGETAKSCQNAATILKTSRCQSPPHSTPCFIWCDILLTGSHHFPVVNTPVLFPSNSSILPLQLPPLIFLTRMRVRSNHHYPNIYSNLSF